MVTLGCQRLHYSSIRVETANLTPCGKLALHADLVHGKVVGVPHKRRFLTLSRSQFESPDSRHGLIAVPFHHSHMPRVIPSGAAKLARTWTQQRPLMLPIGIGNHYLGARTAAKENLLAIRRNLEITGMTQHSRLLTAGD